MTIATAFSLLKPGQKPMKVCKGCSIKREDESVYVSNSTILIPLLVSLISFRDLAAREPTPEPEPM
jgi:hypothetical protein